MGTTEAAGSTVAVTPPFGGKAASTDVVARVGELVVVDHPWREGFAVVVADLGLEVSAHRFATAAQARRAAGRIQGLADWGGSDAARVLRADTRLRRQVQALLGDAAGVLAPRRPVWPGPARTGASYEPGYDAARRAAKQASDEG